MQRTQKASSSSDSSPSPTPPGSHALHPTAIRSESKAELKPLFTQKPLSFSDREKKPSPPPRKRRRQAVPETPALTFNPSQRMIPTGRQEPPQTPVSQTTPISSTNECPPGWVSDEVDDQPPPDTSVYSHPTAFKRPRTSSGSNDSPQFPSYPATYYNFRTPDTADHQDSPLSGGSSSPDNSFGSSPVHHPYGPEIEYQPFHQEMTNAADYAQSRRDVYRSPGYPPPQEGVWPYCPPYSNNAYRD
ncbi:hypothetical protein BDR03DRAFT_1003069 [Suillus americanus]|nr:hypothetical protein BDR03DRAFT_1003069 [Suillus americanus]